MEIWPTMRLLALNSLLLAAILLPTLCSAHVGEDHSAFSFKLDFFASSTGLFQVEEYDGHSPTLEMELNKEYTFYQTDASNWYHPLGFAYAPDGAHVGAPELEFGVRNGDAPQYYINGTLSDLDTYEPAFSFPRDHWLSMTHYVKLTVTDPSVREIFYFCHIHKGMSGRIRIIGHNSSAAEIPLTIPAPPTGMDATCGTADTQRFHADHDFHKYCPDTTFLCGSESSTYGKCMDAIDCKMNYEMRVHNYVANPVVTFMHQMIPHHVNAVNMAKILLKLGGPGVDDDIIALMVDIINSQNAQITFMEAWLAERAMQNATEAICERQPNAAGLPVSAGIVSSLVAAIVGTVAMLLAL